MTDEPDAGWMLDAVAEGRDPLSEWAERARTEPLRVSICGPCYREEGRYIGLVHEDHGDGSSVWRCPNCLHVGFTHFDGGMLDLGNPGANPEDYEVFGEQPWKAPSLISETGGLCRPVATYDDGVVRDSVMRDRYDWAVYGERASRWRRLLRWLRLAR